MLLEATFRVLKHLISANMLRKRFTYQRRVNEAENIRRWSRSISDHAAIDARTVSKGRRVLGCAAGPRTANSQAGGRVAGDNCLRMTHTCLIYVRRIQRRGGWSETGHAQKGLIRSWGDEGRSCDACTLVRLCDGSWKGIELARKCSRTSHVPWARSSVGSCCTAVYECGPAVYGGGAA